MQNLSKKEFELVLKLNSNDMSPTQVRLVKSIHALLANVLSSEEEGEYFEASSELLTKTAEFIKHCDFAKTHKNISYGDQAVEFALDKIYELLDENKIQNLDN
jgi:hypothetical protein